VRVKDSGGCTADVAATIKQLNSTVAASATAADIACGQTSGTITVNASGGSSPYSYSIDGTTYQSSNIFNNLSTGKYFVRVKDAGGCTADVAVTIKQLNSTIAASARAADIVCGQTSGSIMVTASGGSSPYSYSIDKTTYQSSNIFNNLSAGNYSVRVKDASGCIIDVDATLFFGRLPNLIITDPLKKCLPNTINLTASTITAGSDNDLTYTYFTNQNTTVTLTNPDSVSVSGTYYIKGSKANGCSIIKPVVVSIGPKSLFEISPDKSVCSKESIQLKASGGTSYFWQPSEALNDPSISNPVATPKTNITYQVKIKNSTCNDSTMLTTTLTVLSLPVIKATKTNDIDCSNNFAQLNATGGKNYTWQPSSLVNNSLLQNPIAKPENTTVYTVTGTDINGCKNSDTITVKAAFTNKAGYLLPNAFTPNGDGNNDCFGLKYWGNVTHLEFSIYNRFGEKVFYTNDPAQCWDGKYKGVLQNVGAYVYVIKATTTCDAVERRGSFILLK
jgi:gliding motility-associated-like protein